MTVHGRFARRLGTSSWSHGGEGQNMANGFCCAGEKMEIHLNMTFPRVPCELLTLDVMDVSGEQQTGVVHGVSKVRLASVADGGHVIDSSVLALHAPDNAATHLDPEYCGSCYSAPAPAGA